MNALSKKYTRNFRNRPANFSVFLLITLILGHLRALGDSDIRILEPGERVYIGGPNDRPPEEIRGARPPATDTSDDPRSLQRGLVDNSEALGSLPKSKKSQICDTETVPVPSGVTPADCEQGIKKYSGKAYSECLTEVWFRAVAGARYGCLREVMEKELDNRLLSLKKREPKEFSQEMALQKEFNKAVEKFCEFWGGGTAGYYNISDCHSNYYTYRYRQAKLIRTGQLELPEGKPKKSRDEFRPFADAICKLPEIVWAKKALPRNCNEKVLAEMEALKLFRLPMDD
jgi:hypothetical protein